MIGPITNSITFCFLAHAKATVDNNADTTEMALFTSIAAGTAGLIFFGWGFDATYKST